MDMSTERQLFLEGLCHRLWGSMKGPDSTLKMTEYRSVVISLLFLRYLSSDSYGPGLAQGGPGAVSSGHCDSGERPPADADLGDSGPDELGRRGRNYALSVPEKARWEHIQKEAAMSIGAEFCESSGMIVRFSKVSSLIDQALDAIEESNEEFAGVFPRISKHGFDDDHLAGLINTFSDKALTCPEHDGKRLDLRAPDILRHLHRFFLSKFNIAEGQRGGEFYTPESLVELVTKMLRPRDGIVYDPAMGSGGFLLAADAFSKERANDQQNGSSGKIGKIHAYGQEINPAARGFSIMNMIIQDLDFYAGEKSASAFLDDQHPGLLADYAMCHPPFSLKNWGSEKLVGDSRWKICGAPPENNANLAWIQHMLSHLSPGGIMALVLPRSVLKPRSQKEALILRNLVEMDFVECIVSLPGFMFLDISTHGCIWVLSNGKHAIKPTTMKDLYNDEKLRRRKGHVLFINTYDMGRTRDRLTWELSRDDISKISDVFHDWLSGENYADVLGLCCSASLRDIRDRNFSLIPENYAKSSSQGNNTGYYSSSTADISYVKAEDAQKELAQYPRIRDYPAKGRCTIIRATPEGLALDIIKTADENADDAMEDVDSVLIGQVNLGRAAQPNQAKRARGL